MKLKLRPEGGTFPGKRVGERKPGGQEGTCKGPEAGGGTRRNPLGLGPCGWMWRGEATAPGEAEGLTRGPVGSSGGFKRDSGRGGTSQMLIFLYFFCINENEPGRMSKTMPCLGGT